VIIEVGSCSWSSLSSESDGSLSSGIDHSPFVTLLLGLAPTLAINASTPPVISYVSLCIRPLLVLGNKLSVILTLFFLYSYMNQWHSFFNDLFTLIRSLLDSLPTTAFNRHVALLLF
jgi:hypothetical protein